MSSLTSTSQFHQYGSLQHPLDASFRQSSLFMGVTLALVGLIFFPGAVFLVEGQIDAGETQWMEYVIPFLCILGSGAILLAGAALTIDAQYRQRSMRFLGQITRARILGSYWDHDNDGGPIRYMVYEFDVVQPDKKSGRYTLREAVTDDLFRRLEHREFTLVHYVPSNPTIATLDLRDRI